MTAYNSYLASGSVSAGTRGHLRVARRAPKGHKRARSLGRIVRAVVLARRQQVPLLTLYKTAQQSKGLKTDAEALAVWYGLGL
jgi:hypothetical protein